MLAKEVDVVLSNYTALYTFSASKRSGARTFSLISHVNSQQGSVNCWRNPTVDDQESTTEGEGIIVIWSEISHPAVRDCICVNRCRSVHKLAQLNATNIPSWNTCILCPWNCYVRWGPFAETQPWWSNVTCHGDVPTGAISLTSRILVTGVCLIHYMGFRILLNQFSSLTVILTNIA